MVFSLALRMGAAALTLALDRTVFRTARKQLAQADGQEPQTWPAVLATAYGAIAEEVLMRLGLQTLPTAGFTQLAGEASPPGGTTMWPAIGLANLAFGAEHLPATRNAAPLTPAMIARALALNGLPGLIFGTLYWRRGLEATMLMHDAADVILHIVAPRLAR